MEQLRPPGWSKLSTVLKSDTSQQNEWGFVSLCFPSWNLVSTCLVLTERIVSPHLLRGTQVLPYWPRLHQSVMQMPDWTSVIISYQKYSFTSKLYLASAQETKLNEHLPCRYGMPFLFKNHASAREINRCILSISRKDEVYTASSVSGKLFRNSRNTCCYGRETCETSHIQLMVDTELSSRGVNSYCSTGWRNEFFFSLKISPRWQCSNRQTSEFTYTSLEEVQTS